MNNDISLCVHVCVLACMRAYVCTYVHVPVEKDVFTCSNVLSKFLPSLSSLPPPLLHSLIPADSSLLLPLSSLPMPLLPARVHSSAHKPTTFSSTRRKQSSSVATVSPLTSDGCSWHAAIAKESCWTPRSLGYTTPSKCVCGYGCGCGCEWVWVWLGVGECGWGVHM